MQLYEGAMKVIEYRDNHDPCKVLRMFASIMITLAQVRDLSYGPEETLTERETFLRVSLQYWL